jgi:hypothetical protein
LLFEFLKKSAVGFQSKTVLNSSNRRFFGYSSEKIKEENDEAIANQKKSKNERYF